MVCRCAGLQLVRLQVELKNPDPVACPGGQGQEQAPPRFKSKAAHLEWAPPPPLGGRTTMMDHTRTASRGSPSTLGRFTAIGTTNGGRARAIRLKRKR